MEDKLEYPKKEPIFYDRRMKNIGTHMESAEHIGWRVRKEPYDSFNSISKEERQKILGIFSKGGITVKEVGDKLNIDSKVVGHIIFLNIYNVSMLRKESL